MTIKATILTLFALGVLAACTDGGKAHEPGELFAAHCGSCHLVPRPEDLPKAIWKERVLPEMAARMGLKLDGHDPMGMLSWH